MRLNSRLATIEVTKIQPMSLNEIKKVISDQLDCERCNTTEILSSLPSEEFFTENHFPCYKADSKITLALGPKQMANTMHYLEESIEELCFSVLTLAERHSELDNQLPVATIFGYTDKKLISAVNKEPNIFLTVECTIFLYLPSSGDRVKLSMNPQGNTMGLFNVFEINIFNESLNVNESAIVKLSSYVIYIK